ncbi:unnamed protein product [Cylicocyclus nassatus]|uniref:Uncharacterized protein n=1 Tax=Cylicocyclus nassatus TaxID=53992 RepID=A0AA36M169_CYLNA|nr:unnamed protein product [Cylicocyclus nassatus]
MFAYVLFLLAVQMLLITNKADVIPEIDSIHPEDNGTWHYPDYISGNEIWDPNDYLESYEDYTPGYYYSGENDPDLNSIEE